MKEGETGKIVGEWEIPAPGFDSKEWVPVEGERVWPIQIQDAVLSTGIKRSIREAVRTNRRANKISYHVGEPVEKGGRKVFIVQKIIYP